MKKGLRQSMAWLHGWCGVTAGWLLYAIFITGTLSYFRPEISHWMRPELHAALDRSDSIAMAVRELQQRAPHSTRWLITPSGPRDPTLRIGWMVVPERGQPGSILRRFDSAQLNPLDGTELISRETLGGDFFQRFHFELGLKGMGRWVSGACAMFMLVGILSGVITHREIFRNFLRFRPNRGSRSWLDAHTAVAVVALPFYLMITYTGLVMMMLLYMPWGVDANYRDDPGVFIADTFPNPLPTRPMGMTAPLTAIEPLLQQARQHWGDGASPASVTIQYPNDAGARITMLRNATGRLSSNTQSIIFDGVSGEMLSASADEPMAVHVHGVLRGLHVSNFSSTPLRSLFALCGLTGTLMIATGVILWSVRRLPKRIVQGRSSFSHRLVEVINLGTITGLPIGVAVYFWANRLISADLAGRPAWEVRCFFIACAVSYLSATLQPTRSAWRTHLIAGALLFGLLPVVNALTTDTHLGITLANGQWLLAGFDLTMLVIASLLAIAAVYTSRTRTASDRSGVMT